MKTLAKDRNEMCHAPWLVHIALVLFGYALVLLFGWALVGLYYEASQEGLRIIGAILFSALMTSFGLFLMATTAFEMHLKAFFVPHQPVGT